MSILENRLRWARRQCEERRRYLAGLGSLAEKLCADQRRLWAEIELAGTGLRSPEAGQLAGAAGLIERHRKLAGSVAAVDSQIAEIGAALGAAEQELKRHELAAAQRPAQAAASERRRAR